MGQSCLACRKLLGAHPKLWDGQKWRGTLYRDIALEKNRASLCSAWTSLDVKEMSMNTLDTNKAYLIDRGTVTITVVYIKGNDVRTR